MGNVKTLFALIVVIGGGFLFFQNFRIEGLDKIQLVQRDGQRRASRGRDRFGAPSPRGGDTIRVASFNIQVFGSTKVRKTHVMDMLANICRRFDVIAIQEIRSSDQDIVPRLVDMMNVTGAEFDYVIGPRVGRTSSQEQYAFVFDASRVEVDRRQLYTVDDPDDLLHREPLVAWFRALGPDPEQAFTFTLINIHTDPDEAAQEIAVLDDVYRVVQGDGRQEDDLLLLGDFNADDSQMVDLNRVPGMYCVISGVPTNTRGTRQYDNILFTRGATSEYVGRSGVFDFLREFNLTEQQALEISDHMPVWAEFSIYEGGLPGQVAARPQGAVR